MKRLYKNWFVHNMYAHPLSEIAYWCCGGHLGCGEKVSGWIHDATLPAKIDEKGRG